MITLSPTISEANTLAVFALLQVISNPEAAKKTLDEINAAKQEAIAADESARRTSEQNVVKLSEAQAALKAATRIRDDFERTRASRAQQLDDQEATLTTKAAR